MTLESPAFMRGECQKHRRLLHPAIDRIQSDCSAYPGTPRIGIALDRLKAGNVTTESLVQGLAEVDGWAEGEQFAQMLQKLGERGWLNYAVLPLAEAIPMVDSAKLNLTQLQTQYA